jgi:predicted sulfurtransferase
LDAEEVEVEVVVVEAEEEEEEEDKELSNKAEQQKQSKTKPSEETKSLGAWFPTASLRKVPALATDERAHLALFYHYVRPTKMTQPRTDELKSFLEDITAELGIGGRIRFAQEGLNSTISGSKKAIREFAARLSSAGTNGFGKEFKETEFKFIDDLPQDRHFVDMKILPVKELVFYGVNESTAPLSKGGVHLDPKDYHAKMQEKGSVIIDVRNSYEAEIGKFIGQEGKGGAEYIDPKMRKSTDFSAWLDKPETKAKLDGKQVLMYCTGGIRCERASALLKTKIGDKVNGVFQLQGGIEKYFKEFPDGGHWKGLNYVFDKREAVSVESGVAGVGGIVEGKKKRKKKNNDAMGKCCTCDKKWDRYVGKKKCYTCAVPVLMCDSCLTHKIDKIKGRELEVRCTLCKEENITVAWTDTQLTDNGITSMAGSEVAGRAAKSVVALAGTGKRGTGMREKKRRSWGGADGQGGAKKAKKTDDSWW